MLERKVLKAMVREQKKHWPPYYPFTEEEFYMRGPWFIYFDKEGKMIRVEIVPMNFEGIVQMNPDSVMIRAIEIGAKSIIVAHNHEQMRILYPSVQDILLTQKLILASEKHGIHIKDHILLSHIAYTHYPDMHYSMLDKKDIHNLKIKVKKFQNNQKWNTEIHMQLDFLINKSRHYGYGEGYTTCPFCFKQFRFENMYDEGWISNERFCVHFYDFRESKNETFIEKIEKEQAEELKNISPELIPTYTWINEIQKGIVREDLSQNFLDMPKVYAIFRGLEHVTGGASCRNETYLLFRRKKDSEELEYLPPEK